MKISEPPRQPCPSRGKLTDGVPVHSAGATRTSVPKPPAHPVHPFKCRSLHKGKKPISQEPVIWYLSQSPEWALIGSRMASQLIHDRASER
jgi:hypothetical protein